MDPLGERGRQHRGDFMSVETRSRVMSRIKGKDTGPERAVANILMSLGLTPEAHARDLPGRPDFVLRALQIIVFVDGDFWHGWRFPTWRLKLSDSWERKIAANRDRDRRNHAALRRKGWKVLRVWEHQVSSDPGAVAARIQHLVRQQQGKS